MTMCIGMKANKALIGNLMILLADRCKPLYHTKLLKLLFLIDEESVKRTATPMTWLNYKAWQLGPVNEDVFFSKWEGCNKFDQYVHFDFVDEKRCIVKPVAEFDGGGFCELDREIIDSVLSKYGRKSSEELVEILHGEESLWSKAVKKHALAFSATNKTSDVDIDFSDMLKDELQKTVYFSTLENLETELFLNQ